MEDVERASLVSQWWQALRAADAVARRMPHPPRTLGELVDDLAAALDADSFDDTGGTRVGAALVALGLVDPATPEASATVLYRMAAASPRFDTDERVTALLIAIEQGHHRALPRVERPTVTSAEPLPPPPQVADKLFRIAVDNSPTAICLADREGNLLYANRALYDMLGVPADSLHRISTEVFAHPEEMSEINAEVFDRLQQQRRGTVRMQQRLLRGDGSTRWTAFSVTYVRATGDQPDFGLAVAEEITQRHRLQEQLHWQARHDQLTGLANRRHLLERIETIAAAAGPEDRIGLCFADLDRFKEVNDRYGHATGDRVLVAVADRLRDIPRNGDYLAARLGGDEFVLLVSAPTDESCVAAVADDVRAALATPVAAGEQRLRVSVSIGVVVMPVAGKQAGPLLDAADRELYRAKTGGRDRAVHRARNRQR